MLQSQSGKFYFGNNLVPRKISHMADYLIFELLGKERGLIMSILVVLQQMVIIFILIGVGMLLYRRNMLSEATSKQISGIIINVTNPALLICSAFEDGPKVSLGGLSIALAAYAAVFVILIALSFLIPYILGVPKKLHYAYQMLTIFGNVGFIGIPLASAVLGSESLIFVSIFNLLFNLLIYTLGMSMLEKAASLQAAEGEISPAGRHTSGRLQKLVNAGTISAAVTILCYLGDFQVPVILSSTLTYMGRATTLLSMLVLGVSVAQMAPKDIFSHPKLYVFTLLRQILVPIGCVLLMRGLIDNKLILNTMLLMVAVPAANMPLMFAKQMDMETESISQGIILTTVLSLVTVPAACLFLS